MGPPTRRLREEEVQQREEKRAQTEILEKDETERQLEKLLFGDEAGFLDALRRPDGTRETALQRIASGDSVSDEENGDQDEDMQDVADEDLFFLDAGTGDFSQDIVSYTADEDKETDLQHRQPVWVDSDDERVTVSLASNTRLRKLRDTEDDDIVNGKEYIRRLRRQYERLHPTPDWVRYARKHRRTENNANASDSDSDFSTTDGDTSISAPLPLSDVLRSAGSLTRSHSSTTANKAGVRKLRPEVIDIQRLKDIASSGPSSIDTIQFHPYFPLILTAGPSSTINLYHISPEGPNPNPLLTSLHLKNTPLHTAEFCRPVTTSPSLPDTEANDQTRIFLSSRRRYFHTWSLSTGLVQKVTRPLTHSSLTEKKSLDLRTTEQFRLSPCGRYMGIISPSKKGGAGSVHVLSTQTMQWLAACRIDSHNGVADFAWWGDGNGFYVVGKNGEVSEFDMDSKRVVMRWTDEGAVGTTTIAVGGTLPSSTLLGNEEKGGRDRWIAIGSSSGVVNLYDRRNWATSSTSTVTTSQMQKNPITHRPKPVRTFDQLTTPISHLVFSADGQMLLIGSRWKKDALRLVHPASATVYRNWPTDRTPLGRITSIAFSQDGGLLAVANETGAVRLWSISE